MNWIDPLLDSYFKFLKDKTSIVRAENTDWITIGTPFLGVYNDAIEIYVKKNGDNYILSDDGNTLKNLDLMGVAISRSQKRKEICEKILVNYGIKEMENELFTEATIKNFAQKKLNFLSAMIEINDMYVLSKNSIASIFREDVQKYLDEQAIIYTPHFISKGSTGLEFTFDFQIAYRSKEIVIKAFNTVNKMNLPNFLFTWQDIKESREKITGKAVTGVAIINDENKDIQEDYLDALTTKGADIILWKKRHEQANIKKLFEAA